MYISLFDYNLPKNLIAQSPANPRDHSRLLVIDRKSGQISHHNFYEIADMLGKNDVLVLNKTKVFPARLFANKVTGGKVELLFIEEVKPGLWTAMTHPGLKIGSQITFKRYIFDVVDHKGITAVIGTKMDKGTVMNILSEYGKTPLPPYIQSKEDEADLRKEYQTVYAEKTGSVAAPTAGFHFTKRLLQKLKGKGVQIEYVTLHVGLGTFAPVKSKRLEDHPMHSEYFELDKNTSKRLNEAKNSGKRIVAVGTTSTRVLETIAEKNRALKTGSLKGSTNLFIYPGYKFKFVDALITNFHLPKSTLLALVYGFAGDKLMKKVYQIAIKNKYRFYSFGDACFIT